jgi:hypothetical protein
MSGQFIAYAVIAIGAWLIALLIVKPRRAMDLSRCVGWYMMLFLVTYVIRPGGSEIVGDDFMYTWLRIETFEKHWYLMAIAVPMAIIFFAAGYRFVGKVRTAAGVRPAALWHGFVEGRQARNFAYLLIGLGYIATFATIKSGMAEGVRGNYSTANVGVYENNSALIAQSHLMVSTGTVLYYIVTGRLYMSLFLAGPWLTLRLIYGWGRIFIIGHVFALAAIYFLRATRQGRSELKAGQTITLMAAIAVLAFVVFPILSVVRGLKASLGMRSTTFSSDVVEGALNAQFSVPDLASKFFSTKSEISGFEPTYYHLLMDNRSALGTHYLYYFFFQPIPRVIWPGKGTPYTWPEYLRGIQVDPAVGLMGMAPGSIGMAFQEWGWVGIIFEFLFTGWLMRWAEETVRRRPEAVYVQLGYAGFYSMLPQLGRDSLLYMISQRWIYIYGPAVFVLWIVYKNNTRPVHARVRSSEAHGMVQPGLLPGRRGTGNAV